MLQRVVSRGNRSRDLGSSAILQSGSKGDVRESGPEVPDMLYEEQNYCTLWRLEEPSRMKDSSPTPRPRSRLAAGWDEVVKEAEGEEYVRLQEVVGRYHSHRLSEKECSSVVLQRVEAPVSVVWSVVRRFDEPQIYKHFIRSCFVPAGQDHLKVGCLREVRVVSGLPAASSTERLEILDEERHILGFRIVGGDHRLRNYRSITTLHEAPSSYDYDSNYRPSPSTVVVESYVVDVPEGNTEEDTCLFVDTIVKCNLQSLAHICEHVCPRRC